MQRLNPTRILGLFLILCLATGAAFAATKKTRRRPAAKTPAKTSALKKSGAKRSAVHSSRARAKKRRVRTAWSPWKVPTFADSTAGDFIDGEDLVVRRAAVDALGPYNGSVVVVDPSTGRILTMVNQKLALKDGFQPCSTIKIVVSLAGLSEGLIERNTHIRLYGRTSMGLTQALAHSNNLYFASVGQKLGFERVSYYARLFGLGEKAGYDIPGEQPGILPEAPPPSGVGMMTSFGDGITLTPLELASIMSTIANGGTMYYLQYPRSAEEVELFTPRIKRRLDIDQWIPEIKPGMMGAVEFGTARRAAYDPNEPILGKTGTCTDHRTPTHLGWFGSFNEVGNRKLVVVVLLTGGRGVSGPVASGIAGQVYRNLSKVNYFHDQRLTAPIALISSGCCAGQ
jgi:penicillin-binding protein 2